MGSIIDGAFKAFMQERIDEAYENNAEYENLSEARFCVAINFEKQLAPNQQEQFTKIREADIKLTDALCRAVYLQGFRDSVWILTGM